MKAEGVIARLDWAAIMVQLDQDGYAVLPGVLSESQVRDLAALRDSASIDQVVSLASEDLGRGELLYFSQPLPSLVADLRASFYKHLVPVANRWNDVLREGDYAALHQRGDGEQVFPLQLVALLSAPGKDFTGGEFVMTERRPRMQSRPMVLPLRKGDMAIISVAQRPHRGTKGYYRVNLKHAISRMRSGERIGLELVLHDARQG